jgi:hypothetical protein
MPKCARVTRFKGSLVALRTVAEVVDQLNPRVRELDGCEGTLFLVDRLTGRSMAISLWESPEAMKKSEEIMTELRMELADRANEQVLFVERYEVAAE